MSAPPANQTNYPKSLTLNSQASRLDFFDAPLSSGANLRARPSTQAQSGPPLTAESLAQVQSQKTRPV